MSFHSDFTSFIKHTNPSKWFAIAKRIGAVDGMSDGELVVENLAGLSDSECADKLLNTFHQYLTNITLLT